MAGSLNKVCLLGNLGRDPEVRERDGGDKIVRFPMATSNVWRDRETGDRVERTEWHKIVIFKRGLTDVAEKYLKKGSKVYIEGQLQTRKYTSDDGVDRWITEIVLGGYDGELILLGGGERDSESGRPPEPREEPDPGSNAPTGDDEIPF